MNETELPGTADWWRQRFAPKSDHPTKERGFDMPIPIPVIRLEVEHMRHTMLVALSQYTAQLDENLQQAVENYCTHENLAQIIDDETHRVLDQVIREEVKNWFTNGEGRQVIKAAVEKKLKEGGTWTPLDPDWKRF